MVMKACAVLFLLLSSLPSFRSASTVLYLRIMEIAMYKVLRAACLMLTPSITLAAGGSGGATESFMAAPSNTLFTNVNVFNGTDDKLLKSMNVLVEGKTITRISSKSIEQPKGTAVIDGAGKTLMPGMIDGHAHLMINAHFDTIEKNMDLTDIAYRATLSG